MNGNGNYLATEYRAHYDLVHVEQKEESWRQYVKNYKERLLRTATDRQHHALGFTNDTNNSETHIVELYAGADDPHNDLHQNLDGDDQRRVLNLHAQNTLGSSSAQYLPAAVDEKILPIESYADYPFSAHAPKDPTRPPFGSYGYKASDLKTFNVNGLGKVFNPSTGRFEQPTVAAHYHEHRRRPRSGPHGAHPHQHGQQNPHHHRGNHRGGRGNNRQVRDNDRDIRRQSDDDTAGGPRHCRHQHTSVQHFPATGGRSRSRGQSRSPSRPDGPPGGPQRRQGADRNAAMSSSTETAEDEEARSEGRGQQLRQRRFHSDEGLPPSRRGRSHVTAFFRGSEGAAAVDTSWSSEYMTQYRDYWKE